MGKEKLTTEEFVRRARLVHGDKYDYSPTVYVKWKESVLMVCPIHGEFEQTPANHLRGCGCRKCGMIKRDAKNRRTIDEFIAKAILVHGNKFDYSLIKEYVNSKTDVSIKCNTCGHVFQCTPNEHLRGRGCKKCKWTKQSERQKGNPNLGARKLLFGVARVDVPYVVGKTPAYIHWTNVLVRCCDESYKEKKPTYKDCTICEEWKLFSNFKKWFDENYVEGYALDKDILVKGNKVYSPYTCCFVPMGLNSLLTKRDNHRGDYPIGVLKPKRGRFIAEFTKNKKRCIVGRYDTPEEAFYAYKEAKEKHIKDVAQEYFNKGLIAENVYQALLNYEIEITD